jgi:hypothetical protein
MFKTLKEREGEEETGMEVEKLLEKSFVFNRDNIIWREIGEEIVFLQRKEKNFYEGNKTASFICRQLVKGKTAHQIIRGLQKNYSGVEAGVLKRDVVDFINKGLKAKTLVIKE